MMIRRVMAIDSDHSKTSHCCIIEIFRSILFPSLTQPTSQRQFADFGYPQELDSDIHRSLIRISTGAGFGYPQELDSDIHRSWIRISTGAGFGYPQELDSDIHRSLIRISTGADFGYPQELDIYKELYG